MCVFEDGAIGLLVGGFASLLKMKFTGKLSDSIDQADVTIDVVDGAMKVDLSGNLNYINVVDFETRVLDTML